MKRDHRIVLDVEEVFALQLAVLHAASGIHTGCLNLDVQNASGDVRRGKRQSGVPLVESAVYGTDAFTWNVIELCCRRNNENRRLRSA